MSFYNSNKERGATLAKSRKKAAKQDVEILNTFKGTPNANYTAWEMFIIFKDWQGWPITSIRRSINTLCKAGKIIETDAMRFGGYGKPNRVYKYNPKAK